MTFDPPLNRQPDDSQRVGSGRQTDDEEQAQAVRPYAVTRGRTKPAGGRLALEALVTGGAPAPDLMDPEKRRITELAAGRYLSIAEVSAHVQLPVGVVRVLVGDLIQDGLVLVHQTEPVPCASPQASTLSLLESVLDGISTL